MNSHLKIGYALGGGAARGLAHIGILKVLEEYHIYPDIIVGTSMGAVVGAIYASGCQAKDIERLAVGLDWRRLLLTDISLTSGGFIQGKRVAKLLKSILGDLDFSDLKYSFACATTDVITGKEVILRDGSLIDAIHASISLPGIFKPVKVGGQYLVDGGLLNEVPVDVCRRLGAPYVIGVNVIPDPAKTLPQPKKNSRSGSSSVRSSRSSTKHSDLSGNDFTSRFHLAGIEQAIKDFISHQGRSGYKSSEVNNTNKPPSLLEVVRQSLAIMQYHVAMENIRSANIAINPDVAGIGFWQFHRAAETIGAGEQAAREALQQSIVIEP